MTCKPMYQGGLAAMFVLFGGGVTNAASAVDESKPFYDVRVLVSDRARGADHVDESLRNAWGIARDPEGIVWIANNRTNTATFYDGTGTGVGYPEVEFPAGTRGAAAPTGVVFNDSQDFSISRADGTEAAHFIFAGDNGVLMGWAPALDQYKAIVVYQDEGGAIYKGLALAQIDGRNFLYATDFHNARVDVFDSTFARAVLSGRFEDPYIPPGYAPFGIQNIRGDLYVTFARQDAAGSEAVVGAGFGFVDVFDTRGTLLRRIDSQAMLNAPWSVALAPEGFGAFSSRLLVANSGDGTIAAFDAASGAFLGALPSSDGQVLRIAGLRGLSFGNGSSEAPANSLFFTSGPSEGQHGEYGRIDATGAEEPAMATE